MNAQARATQDMRVLPRATVDLLESLYQHRLLTSKQIHALHHPHASRSWTFRLLAGLRDRGLIAATTGEHGKSLWFMTQDGAETVEAISHRVEPRRRISSPAQAAGPLRAHTLSLNDACISFVTAARERGDECGPLSWRHEIAHRLAARGPRGSAGMVIADALLSYLQIEQQAVILHQRFIELDRGSTPVEDLAGKLARYSLLRDQPPSNGASGPDWRTRYRAFPDVQVVIASLSTRAYMSRVQRTIALYRTDPQVRERRPLPISFTRLEQLTARGPFAAIFISIQQPDRYVDWLGNSQPATQER